MINPEAINLRLNAIDALVEDQILLLELREAMGSIRDIERTITRLNVGAANARDLIVLEKGLSSIPSIKEILNMLDIPFINSLRERLIDLSDITNLILSTIIEEPPLTIKDGGIIKEEYDNNLDELRKGATEGKRWIAELQIQEQEATCIKNLKIRFNKVFGYYIEISNSNKHLAPER